MPYLMYSRRTHETGEQLVGVLGIPGGQNPPGGTAVDVLVRWGSSENVPHRPGRVINKRNAILLAADKRRSLLHLALHHVPTPRTFEAAEGVLMFPVLGRQDHHTRGTDIVLCMQAADLATARQAGCTHFTQYIPTAREFRVHVFGREVIKISEKLLTDPTTRVPHIRNVDHGYTFRRLRPIMPTVRQQIDFVAIAAVEALGLDFGAVDVVLGDDGFSRVLEVNTGPSLAENSLGVYARKLATVLGLDPAIVPTDLDQPEED